MAKEDFIFFWGGTYSQWMPSPFKIDGVTYVTAEQYMMAKKALLFGDYDALKGIMETNDPSEQKAIGRTIKGFNKERWEAVCLNIVIDGNYAKFKQNPKMLEELLATGSKEIVEASPNDKIWGIGLHETDPKAWDKETWEGSNWLGIAIMEARSRLQKEFSFSVTY